MASSEGLCFFLIVLMIVGTGKASRWLENTSETHEPKRCGSIYGFLPCADTMVEGIFLILMYSYLLMMGEELIHKGSEAVVSLFGNKKIGGIIYGLLMALPRVIIVFVSGVICTHLNAQKQVDFGVDMYAGSTVFSLTAIWGARVILLKEKLLAPTTSSTSKKDSSLGCFCRKLMPSCLTEDGVNLKHQVREKALVMLLSLIPFLIVLLVQVRKSRLMILIAVIVSCMFLLCFICHQSLEKVEPFEMHFLEYLERKTDEPLFDENLQPNMHAIRSVFEEIDGDNDHHITKEELGKLIDDVLQNNDDKKAKENAKLDILWHFDSNKDEKIDLKEFKKGCARWLNELVRSNGQKAWNKVYSSIVYRSLARILDQLEHEYHIINVNKEVNDDEIKKMFDGYDIDKNGKMNRKELRKAIEDLHLGYRGYEDTIFEYLMEEFARSKKNDISVDEIKGWIEKLAKRANNKNYKKEHIEPYAKKSLKRKREILCAVSGLVIILLFARPFVQSVIQFSTALHIPSLFTSFVVVPVFMNTRSMVMFALSLIYNPSIATTKKSASATFSELYGELVMNNLMGLTAMLGIVYVRGLTWDYTPEVATIVVISLIMGIPAALKSRYLLWTSILAFFLYALTLSLFCVYVWARA